MLRAVVDVTAGERAERHDSATVVVDDGEESVHEPGTVAVASIRSDRLDVRNHDRAIAELVLGEADQLPVETKLETAALDVLADFEADSAG